jgi:hypothetical protein
MIYLKILTVTLAACTPTQRTATLALTSTALIAADWHQTRSGITASCFEQNPIIGACGENVPPDLYFPVAIALNLAAGLVLPRPWRDVWFAGVTGAQTSTVWSNWRRE